MAPCLIQTADPDLPTAKVGGQTAVVTYAGWVADSIAGLYQVNIQLPTNSSLTSFTLPDGVTTINGITAPVQLPIVVKANNVYSQGNVTIWVAPRLTVKDPDGNPTASPLNTLTEHCRAGASCNATFANPVIATGGAGGYTYAVTSGLLPAGLSLIGGAITGIPAPTPRGTSSDCYGDRFRSTSRHRNCNLPLQVDGGLVVTGTPSTITSTFGNRHSFVPGYRRHLHRTATPTRTPELFRRR